MATNTHVCKRCQNPSLVLTDFTPDKRNKTGRQAICRQCTREIRAEKHNANRQKGLCFCGDLPAPDSSMCLRHQKTAREQHQRLMQDPVWAANLSAKFKRKRFDIKMESFQAYGGPVCTCCGEAHIEFLTIDHIHGNGGVPRNARHRKGEGLYRWLKKEGWPEGFRVLCMNCNFAHGHAGYCPHEREAKGSYSKPISHTLVASSHSQNP